MCAYIYSYREEGREEEGKGEEFRYFSFYRKRDLKWGVNWPPPDEFSVKNTGREEG